MKENLLWRNHARADQKKAWKYDGDVACCPNCKLPAIEWRTYNKILKKGV